jgi:SAM-dependent methyltransferase
MGSPYGPDLAYIHAAAFGGLARNAAPEIVRLLKSAVIRIRNVLDLGCGAGVLTAALVSAGFRATGVDTSTDLLAMARAAVQCADFVQASIYDFPLPRCEAIVAVGEPLTYHADPEQADALVQDFFCRAARVLPSGGILIFDVIETGAPLLTARFWASGEDWAALADTTEDQRSRTLVRTIETFRKVGDLYRRGREVHTIRLFDTEQMAAMLAGCGFATITAQAYGSERLPARRRAFICTRTGQDLQP